MSGETLDPVTCADNYRRAVELAAQARRNLIAAAAANRSDVNVSGLARRAGIYHGTLRKWVESESEVSDGGQQPATV